jgi:hypothetical protein
LCPPNSTDLIFIKRNLSINIHIKKNPKGSDSHEKGKKDKEAPFLELRL